MAARLGLFFNPSVCCFTVFQTSVLRSLRVLNPRQKRLFALVASLSLLGLLPSAAAADQHTQVRYTFDIPAQQLADALLRHGEIVGSATFYPSQLMAGLRSAPVQGVFTQEQALLRLLQGTGLLLEKQHGTGKTIYRLRSPHGSNTSVARQKPSASMDGHLARLQQGVLGYLCAAPATQPGSYRALLQIALRSDGYVHQLALLDSTGDRVRDQRIIAQLGQARFPAPPRGAAQVPYLISLLPQPDGSRPACFQAPRP